jgi:hypothetical protein
MNDGKYPILDRVRGSVVGVGLFAYLIVPILQDSASYPWGRGPCTPNLMAQNTTLLPDDDPPANPKMPAVSTILVVASGATSSTISRPPKEITGKVSRATTSRRAA